MNIGKLGVGIGSLATNLVFAGVVLSVVDIMYTWTSSNATLEMIKGHIFALEAGARFIIF